MTEAQQLKLVTKRSLEQTYISQASSSGADEGTSSIPGVPDLPTDEFEEELSWDSTEDEGHDEEEDEDELYSDINFNQGRGIQMTQEVEDSHVTLTPVNHDEKTVNEELEAKVLTRSSHSSKTSYAVAADLSEMELKKILIEKWKAINTYRETDTLKRCQDDDADKDEEPSAGPDQGSKRRREGKEPESASAPTKTATRSADRSTQGNKSRQASKPPSPDHDWNKTVPATHGSIQPWISELVKLSDSRSYFNELMDTPMDFYNFLINRLKVDTLTLKLLAGPTYELMKGLCKSLVVLEYHLEEVYKATTNQLDWVNPEGQQYPHNLLKPLTLIPNNRVRRVIPFEHFINNDLEYLRVGALSRKYTTSIMKTKAADYEHIKWIEDLVPRTMWIKEPIGYDKHALWGVSHWGHKRQQFYGFAVNRESARDVYSKRRIIAEPINYDNHALWRVSHWGQKRQQFYGDGMLNDVRNALDDRLKGIQMQYLPTTIWRKGDKDRAAAMIQAIDKMLKTRRIMRSLESVSLRMFTRSIVIQRRVDLQLGVQSYQKKLNLTKPDSYRSDLKRKEAYIAY
nr:hypothetical protein [Tanacetum cinerariifolium]